MSAPKSTPNGIVVLDKPSGITSRDAVDLACKRLRTREIGHCGTLDPLATGVLVLVVGRARRLQELFSRSSKTYRATIRLGARSETDDAEGPIEETADLTAPEHKQVHEALQQFKGEIQQRPPRFSAVKVDGKRLYALARKGDQVEAPMRTVMVHKIELESYDFPNLDLLIECAGGTYVRSIARDLGEILGTGGYLAKLSRVSSGVFDLSQAANPEELEPEQMVPLETALATFSRIDIAGAQARRLANGAELRVNLPALSLDEEQALFGWVNGHVVCMLKKVGRDRVRSSRMLVTADELYQYADQELAAEVANPKPPHYGSW